MINLLDTSEKFKNKLMNEVMRPRMDAYMIQIFIWNWRIT